MKYSHSSQHRKTCPHDPDHRAQLGFRLRSARRNLGWSASDAAKNLQVTERTWHNWENGSHRIPYAVYKLLRVLARLELPGAAWAGWSLQGGNLVTSENHVITPQDGAWWSLMVRKAKGFLAAYHEANRLRLMLQGHGIDPKDGMAVQQPEGTRLRGVAGGEAAGLVPFKTKRSGQKQADIIMTSQCSQTPLQTPINDVIITSWPILYDSPPPLTHLHATGQAPSASASMPCSPSPWTPTCDLRDHLHRPSLGPHLSPPPLPRPPSRPPRPPKVTKPPAKGIPALNGSSSPLACVPSARPSRPTSPEKSAEARAVRRSGETL